MPKDETEAISDALKIRATLQFVKEKYAVMEANGEGYLKGRHARSKPKISDTLHTLLAAARRKPCGAKLKDWGEDYIREVMDREEIWYASLQISAVSISFHLQIRGAFFLASGISAACEEQHQ